MDLEMNGHNTESGDVDAEGETVDVRMVLWTRRPVCGPRTAVIDRLSELRTADAIGTFDVETWPDEIALSGHTEHAEVVDVYREYRDWAEDHGLSITPPFEKRTVSSLIGGQEEVLTVPIMCLAVYEDDDLSGVYPCSNDDRTWSVTDYLDAYAAAEGPPPGGDGEADLPVDA